MDLLINKNGNYITGLAFKILNVFIIIINFILSMFLLILIVFVCFSITLFCLQILNKMFIL